MSYFAKGYYHLERIVRMLSIKNRSIQKRILKKRNDLYKSWWYDAAEKVGAEVTPMGYGFLKINKGNKHTFVKDGLVMLDSFVQLEMAGNKPLVYSILRQHSLKTSRYVEFGREHVNKAIDLLNQIENPIVVKPAYGTAAGQGVTTGIVSEKSLKKATNLASTYCPHLIAEEQVPGNSYRLIFLEGRFVDAIRRDPPSVVGDGKHNLKELINVENKARFSATRPKAVNPLFSDLECKQWLKEQGLSLKHIPPSGKKVIVKRVVNQNGSDDNHVVRDEVCDDIIRQCQKVISYMGITLAGVDIIAERLDISLEESGGVINEINTTPGLHHHALVSSEKDAFPIFERLLEYLLSTKSNKLL